MEVPSPVAGVITELLAEEGQNAPNGRTHCLDTDGRCSRISRPQSHCTCRSHRGTAKHRPHRCTVDGRGARRSTGAGNVVIPATQDTAASEQSGRSRQRRRYSPAVQRLADEHGIDLSQVQGTGISGRITRRMCLHTPKLGHSPQSLKRLPPLRLRFRPYRLAPTKSACRCPPCAE